MAADPEHENRWEKADREQYPPCGRLRQEPIDRGVDEGRRAPPDCPAGLYQPDAAPAVFVADHLAHQNRARRPFAAKAEAMQRAQDEKLLEILREGAQEGEDRVPDDGDLQHLDSAVTIGERAAR